MRLDSVPRGSRIRVIGDIKVPPGSQCIEKGDELTFHRIDGMYGHCTDKDHNRVYLVAWAEVQIIES